MSKNLQKYLSVAKKFAAAAALAMVGVVSFAGLVPQAQASGYLIQTSDTIPVFEAGATAVKDNGLAMLTIAVPYLAGAAVAFALILIIWVVVSYFRSHRA